MKIMAPYYLLNNGSVKGVSNADRRVNRLANLIEPVMGSVSPVVTSKPRPGTWGRVKPSMHINTTCDHRAWRIIVISLLGRLLFRKGDAFAMAGGVNRKARRLLSPGPGAPAISFNLFSLVIIGA